MKPLSILLVLLVAVGSVACLHAAELEADAGEAVQVSASATEGQHALHCAEPATRTPGPSGVTFTLTLPAGPATAVAWQPAASQAPSMARALPQQPLAPSSLYHQAVLIQV